MSDERHEQEKKSPEDERHLYLVQPIKQDRGRRSFWRNPWAWSSIAIFLLLIGGAAMLNRAAGRPGPELPGDTAQQGSLIGFQGQGDPLNANTIHRRIHDVRNDLDGPDWPAAEKTSDNLWTSWLTFRPRMQAQAGTEMWDTNDVRQFETTLRGLVDSIEQRDVTAARGHAETLSALANKYTQIQPRVREGPVSPEGLAN